MAYYGSGYSQGINGDLNPVDASPQGAPIAPTGFNAAASGPTNDSKATATPTAAQQISPPALATAGQTKQAGHYQSFAGVMGGLPSWASQYIDQTAPKNASAGQLNDSYMNAAPTLSGLYGQYGGAFDPSKFTGLGNGSLLGLQNSLQGQGYGLDNIGSYYQNQSMNKGPQAGVSYGYDPNFGITGSIGGLSFDVMGNPIQNGQNKGWGTPMGQAPVGSPIYNETGGGGMPWQYNQNSAANTWNNYAASYLYGAGTAPTSYKGSLDDLKGSVNGANPATQTGFQPADNYHFKNPAYAGPAYGRGLMGA